MLTDGKITARNYAVQAVNGMSHWSGQQTDRADRAATKLLCGMIEGAVHFAVPDFGRIFDDQLKGLIGQPLRLPYPMVSVEFFVPRVEEKLTGDTPTYSPRRVVVLAEMDRKIIFETRRRYEAAGFGDIHVIGNPNRLAGDDFIFCACAAEIDGIWRPMAATWLLPVDDWHDRITEQGHGVKGELGILLNGFAIDLVKRYGAAEARKAMQIDIEAELRTALEFMEAVTCANVVEAVHESGANPSVNTRRIRDGKLPIHETKTLTVDPIWLESHYKSRSSWPSDRASPRQHLRRGHIRRIDRGTRFERSIWIPPMIVGDIERGRIDKNYKVKV